jgi:hypothetical protein
MLDFFPLSVDFTLSALIATIRAQGAVLGFLYPASQDNP